MSDGERVAFYLLGQSRCAPQNSIIVIDEPEIHLRRAVQLIFWDPVEAARPDCVFVYIAHDLEFAATRTSGRKIWMKGFDGTHWEWEEIEPLPELPEQLLFQVLESRCPVPFVEGDEQSDASTSGCRESRKPILRDPDLGGMRMSQT